MPPILLKVGIWMPYFSSSFLMLLISSSVEWEYEMSSFWLRILHISFNSSLFTITDTLLICGILYMHIHRTCTCDAFEKQQWLSCQHTGQTNQGPCYFKSFHNKCVNIKPLQQKQQAIILNVFSSPSLIHYRPHYYDLISISWWGVIIAINKTQWMRWRVTLWTELKW